MIANSTKLYVWLHQATKNNRKYYIIIGGIVNHQVCYINVLSFGDFVSFVIKWSSCPILELIRKQPIGPNYRVWIINPIRVLIRLCVTAIDRQVSDFIVPFLRDQEGLVFTVKIRRSFRAGGRFIQQNLQKIGLISKQRGIKQSLGEAKTKFGTGFCVK